MALDHCVAISISLCTISLRDDAAVRNTIKQWHLADLALDLFGPLDPRQHHLIEEHLVSDRSQSGINFPREWLVRLDVPLIA